MSTLETGIAPNILDIMWVYYVSYEDPNKKCELDTKFGMTFMMIPKGNPMSIDFSDINNKVGFVKVCANKGGDKGGETLKDKDGATKPYLLMNCAFDTCETANWQDKMLIENEENKSGLPIKGNCR